MPPHSSAADCADSVARGTLILGLLLALGAGGCTSNPAASSQSQQPARVAKATSTRAVTPPPARNPAVGASSATGETGPNDVKSLLGVWRHTGEWVDVPPLSSLDWKPLAEGTTLAADSLIITGARSSVVVHIPRRSLTDRFAALVADGRILGYQTADDQVEIAIEADTLFPLRLPPDAVPTGATLEARVVKVTGAAIRSTDREAIAHGYGALTAHNPPYPPRSSRTAAAPDLAPQPVHVKKGLGVRGKDLSSLPADAVRRLYLDETEGVYVDAVIPDSPAARAGLQPHDVIRQLDGKAVRNAQELLRVLEAAPSDRPVDIVVLRTIIDLRTSKAFKSQVTLGEFSGNARVVPDAAPTAQPAPPSPAGSTFPALAPASAVPSAAAPASAAP